jgi:hypothetical protein
MQTTRIVQAVLLMTIVALAASCAASKEYTSKLFNPRIPVAKDSQVLTLRFLELDKLENADNLVSTDIINGVDTNNTVALDNLAKTYHPSLPDSNTVVAKKIKTDSVVVAEKKIVPPEPVARSVNPGEVRSKRTREK